LVAALRGGDFGRTNERSTDVIDRRVRYRIEFALAFVSASLLALTLAWPEWIEGIFGFEPDGGSGAAEWAIALGLLLVTATLFALGRRDRRLALAAGRP
jgi:hypothetical protein